MRSMREQETGVLVVVPDDQVNRACEALHAQQAVDGSLVAAMKGWSVDYTTRTVIRLDERGIGGSKVLMVHATDDVYVEMRVVPACVMPDRPVVKGGRECEVYLMSERDFNSAVIRHARNLLGSTR